MSAFPLSPPAHVKVAGTTIVMHGTVMTREIPPHGDLPRYQVLIVIDANSADDAEQKKRHIEALWGR